MAAAPEFLIVARVRRAHGVRGDVVLEVISDEPEAIFASGRRVFAGTADGELARAAVPGAGDPVAGAMPDAVHETAPDITPDTARTLRVAHARPFGQGLLVHFEEIPDRTTADRWRGRYLLLPASELSEPAEGEAFYHELVGMQVVLPEGEPLGAVVALYELPQGLTLEVAREPAGALVLLPLGEQFVRSIDRAARRIVADPPPGLFD